MQSGGNTSHGRGRGSGEWHTSVYAAWKHVNYVNFPKTLHLGKWSLCRSLKKKRSHLSTDALVLNFPLKTICFFFSLVAAPGQKHICPTFMWTLQSHSGAVSAVERTGFVGFNTFTGLSLLSRHTVTASYRHVLLMSLLLKYIHRTISSTHKEKSPEHLGWNSPLFFFSAELFLCCLVFVTDI